MTTTSLFQIPVDRLKPSPTNPRQIFDGAYLDELSTSIKKDGVLQPIIVRNLPGGRAGVDFEIVAGERRWRAASAAGLKQIPAIVRELTDDQVLEIQIVENLQRRDLHPLEEAEGYEAMREKLKLSADEIAARFGKSKAYVYARLKLCALPEVARKLFYEGKLDASSALLVARIPVKDLAIKAAREISGAERTRYGRGEPMSYREAVQHVEREYMLRLSEAPFDRADPELVKAAGACGTCPKRTGNQRELFAGVSADVCTDPVCFKLKSDRSWSKQKAAAEADGRKVLEGRAADQARYSHSFVDLSDRCYQDPKARTYRQLLGKDAPASVLIRHDNQVEEKIDREAAQRKLREKFDWMKRTTLSSSTTASSRKAERLRKQRKAAVRDATPVLIQKAEAFKDERKFLRLVVEDLMRGVRSDVEVIAKRRGIQGKIGYFRETLPAPLAKYVAGCTVPQLRGLLLELIVAGDAVPAYGSNYGTSWSQACKLLGVDLRAFERKIAAASKAKAKPKRKARKGGGSR